MKKIIAVFSVVALLAMTMAGCNYQLIDTTYSYDRAIVQLPDGTIVEGEVDSWKDYEGDQIQVVIDKTTYLVHSTDVVLIAGGEEETD